MQKAHLHSSVTNEVITKLVENVITEAADNDLVKLGSTTATKVIKADMTLMTKVWGFNRDRSKIILEVKINDISVNRVIVDKRGASYSINTNPRFISDYKRKVGVQS